MWRTRSRTSSRSRRGTSGAGLTYWRSYIAGLFVRMISSTSRNPAVVISPVVRQLELQQCVQYDGRAVDERVDVGEALAVAALAEDAADAGEDAPLEVVRRRRRLVHVQLALLVEQDQIGERAPDVGGEPVGHRTTGSGAPMPAMTWSAVLTVQKLLSRYASEFAWFSRVIATHASSTTTTR